jgi:hypothetical protein
METRMEVRRAGVGSAQTTRTLGQSVNDTALLEVLLEFLLLRLDRLHRFKTGRMDCVR